LFASLGLESVWGGEQTRRTGSETVRTSSCGKSRVSLRPNPFVFFFSFRRPYPVRVLSLFKFPAADRNSRTIYCLRPNRVLGGERANFRIVHGRVNRFEKTPSDNGPFSSAQFVHTNLLRCVERNLPKLIPAESRADR